MQVNPLSLNVSHESTQGINAIKMKISFPIPFMHAFDALEQISRVSEDRPNCVSHLHSAKE